MSPRTQQQFKEMREEKMTLIMDVALEHFANNGFHATTISHIARHAGISKGLMYNYFKSKEELLGEIINRSITEIYMSFDPDRDGYLSDEEFELFIRRALGVLKENRQFWRLLVGIMLQRGVYEKLLATGLYSVGQGNVTLKGFTEHMTNLLTNYFRRKQTATEAGSDPSIDLLMFINTLKGFAVTLLFAGDMYPDEIYEKTIDAIVKMYR